MLVAAFAALLGCTDPAQIAPRMEERRFLLGAFLGDQDLPARHAEFTRLTGSRPAMLLTFVPWQRGGGPSFPAGFCRFARDYGATPLITWEPWDPKSQWYPMLRAIAAGHEDTRVRDWATSARQWRFSVLLRFAHEMNGDWYPWCERKDPRQAARHYVAAYRHIWEVFREAGASNVQWVWAPNFEPTDRLDRYYPGNDCVDYIGIDLYNQPRWPRDPADMLGPLLEFAGEKGKPVILTEVGSAEAFATSRSSVGNAEWADKARWIDRLFEVVAARPDIRGLAWFDVWKEADWRIGSSPEAAAAFRRGLLRLDTQDVMKR